MDNVDKSQGNVLDMDKHAPPKGGDMRCPRPPASYGRDQNCDNLSTVQKVDSCSEADLIATAERAGFELVARLDPPPVLCERCQARMPFTGRRCAKCDAAWRQWLGVSRERVFGASGRRAG